MLPAGCARTDLRCEAISAGGDWRDLKSLVVVFFFGSAKRLVGCLNSKVKFFKDFLRTLSNCA